MTDDEYQLFQFFGGKSSPSFELSQPEPQPKKYIGSGEDVNLEMLGECYEH